jgi:hypothetical protein
MNYAETAGDRVIGSREYEARLRKMRLTSDFSKVITVCVGGYLDGLGFLERKHLVEDLGSLALDEGWEVNVAKARRGGPPRKHRRRAARRSG